MMNKSLLILTIASLSFTAFLSGYLISQKDFHRNPDTEYGRGNILDKFNGDSSGPSPAAYPSGAALLTSRDAVSPVLSKEKDSVIYYEKGTGRVFEVSLKDRRESSVSDVSLPNLIKTAWSPTRKEVVSLFYNPRGSRYKYFSYRTRASVDLGQGITSLVFSPDGSQVAYFKNTEPRGIFISQPDGSSAKIILPTRLENIQLYWPSDDVLSFLTNTNEGSELYSLSKAGDIRKIIDVSDGLEVKWSHDSSRVLFSKREGSSVNLYYKDIASGIETPLNTSTSASKCAWGIDGKTVVCGVPHSSASGDEFYEIGLDGSKTLLASPSTKINTAELELAGLDDYIVILNDIDSKLYMLKK